MMNAVFEDYLDKDDGNETLSVIGLFLSRAEAESVVFGLPICPLGATIYQVYLLGLA